MQSVRGGRRVCWVTHCEGLLLHEGCEAVLSRHLVDDLSEGTGQLGCQCADRVMRQCVDGRGGRPAKGRN
jgi:hypothetical protein